MQVVHLPADYDYSNSNHEIVQAQGTDDVYSYDPSVISASTDAHFHPHTAPATNTATASAAQADLVLLRSSRSSARVSSSVESWRDSLDLHANAAYDLADPACVFICGPVCLCVCVCVCLR